MSLKVKLPEYLDKTSASLRVDVNRPFINKETGEIVILEELFAYGCFGNDQNNYFQVSSMRGATGTTCRAVTNEEYEERTDRDNIKENYGGEYEECWKNDLQEGRTDKNLDGWLDEMMDIDGEESAALIERCDWKDEEKIRAILTDEENSNIELFEVNGCGRIFGGRYGEDIEELTTDKDIINAVVMFEGEQYTYLGVVINPFEPLKVLNFDLEDINRYQDLIKARLEQLEN
jgi:hypothetical protein